MGIDQLSRGGLRCQSSRHHQSHVGTPHVTRVCELPVEGLQFPLKADYDRINMGLFDPRITVEDYDPWDIAELARGAELATKDVADGDLDTVPGGVPHPGDGPNTAHVPQLAVL